MGRIPKRKTQRAPPVDKMMKPVGVAILAMLGYNIIKGLNSEIPRVDVNDELFLREVFFGEGVGNDYAVLCHGEETKIPVSSVFREARSDGSAPAEFLLLDCNHVLPDSGKTVAERFELDLKKRPTVFVSGKQGPPKQMPEKALKTGAMFTRALRAHLEPRTVKIENTKQLKAKCLNQDHCALFLKGGVPANRQTKDTMMNLILSHPKVTFASIDSSALMLTNMPEQVPLYSKGTHRFVMFQKVSGGLEADTAATDTTSEDKPDKTKSSRLITSVVGFTGKSMNFQTLSEFVNGVVNGSTTAKKISSLPIVKTRTKKLEEQERQKRQRAQNRKREQQQKNAQSQGGGGSGGGGGGAFSANTKESRKEDRDRRREQHLADSGKRERTPEEIAERERQRRIRMEEEAEKWNMVPDDAPEEGEYVEDDGGDEFMDFDEDEDEEDDSSISSEGEDEVGEDEEDVMDLD